MRDGEDLEGTRGGPCRLTRVLSLTDRFMIGNANKVDGLNVRQTELRTSIETRKKEMNDLVKHKGQDIDKMIER